MKTKLKYFAAGAALLLAGACKHMEDVQPQVSLPQSIKVSARQSGIFFLVILCVRRVMPSVGVDDYLVRGVRFDWSSYSRKVSCYKYKYTYNIDIYKRLTIYFQQFMGFRYNFLKTQIAKATERKRHNERRRIFTRRLQKEGFKNDEIFSD